MNLLLDTLIWIWESVRDLDLKEAPFTWEVSRELPFIMLPYRDPAGRFLVATACAYDMALVTSDESCSPSPI